jgi:hypothetical protein
MGADTSVVSVLQLVRLLTILGMFPTLFGFMAKKIGEKTSGAAAEKGGGLAQTAGASAEVRLQAAKTPRAAAAGGAAAISPDFPAGRSSFP